MKSCGALSPISCEVGLEVPTADNSEREELKQELYADSITGEREYQPLVRANSVSTDRTDYSGLNDGNSLKALSEKDQMLHRALEEANQQHQWAMEAVIRGWEGEKADLMQKLRRMTEARDTLEAELKHSENSFAGMLEGMLDQKLDQMLLMLQDCGAKSPPTKSGAGSPSNVAAQPTVRKAQQVVHDLGAMLESMKLQQAAIEARVSTMQSAVLQLLPESESSSPKAPEDCTPAHSDSGMRLKRPATAVRKALHRSLVGVGSVCHQTRHFLSTKVPQAAHAAGDCTARAVTAPLHCASHMAGRVSCYLRQQGMKNEHITAVAGAAAGVLATTFLVRNLRPGRASRNCEDVPPGHCDVHEIEIMGAESPAEDDGSVEIILNRNGVFRRAGPEEPALIVAWPI